MTNTDYRSAATNCLKGLAELVSQGAEPEESLDYVYSSFTDLLPFDRVGFASIDAEGATATAKWARANGPVHLRQGFSAKLAYSSLGIVIAHKKPRILNDLPAYLEKHPTSKSTELIVREGIRSSVTCPLFVAGFPTGLLFFSCKAANAYDEHHCQLLKEVVGVLSVALLASQNDRVKPTSANTPTGAKTLFARQQHAMRPDDYKASRDVPRAPRHKSNPLPAINGKLTSLSYPTFIKSISCLTEDMVFDEAVYRSDGRLLVKAGLRPTEALLKRLIKMDDMGELKHSRIRVRDWDAQPSYSN